MATSVEKPVRISGKSRPEEKKGSSSRDGGKKRPTLKELQEKKYLFPNSNLSGMLDDLLENGIIELLVPKRPEEARRTTDPKYCRYHRVISHPLEKCITLKERIMQLARDERIILDIDDSIAANHISAEVEHSLPSWQQSLVRSYEQEKTDAISSKGEGLFTIQFGSLEPIIIPLVTQISTVETSLVSDDGEGWKVVTR